MQRRCWYLEMADPKKRLIRSDRGLSDLEIISRSQPLSDPVGSRPELERVAIGLLERLMPAPRSFRAVHVLGSSGLLSRGFEDQPCDFVGMGDQREMAGLHLDGLGAHPLGHEALKVRIDRAVFR